MASNTHNNFQRQTFKLYIVLEAWASTLSIDEYGIESTVFADRITQALTT